MHKHEAETIMRNTGWLRNQPASFQDEVMQSSILKFYEPEKVIFRMGDEAGGIYGLVEGVFGINTAPRGAPPKLIQMSLPGYWTGEGSYFTRQPRRMGLRAILPTWVMYLPLSQMDRIAHASPAMGRSFGLILMNTIDVAVRIINDLQHPDPSKRVAAALDRAMASGTPDVSLTQGELGEMSCASRSQVNRILRAFEAKGWVRCFYGGVSVLDSVALKAFVSRD